MAAGVLFDFDGTLVDTFDDIVAAVQAMRCRLDAAPLAGAEVRRHIGWGIHNLIGQCHPALDELRPDRLPADGEPCGLARQELERALEVFRAAYGAALLVHTRPYDGIPELCRRLMHGGIRQAVVSNKPECFTRRLLAALGLADPFGLVLGGDSLPMRKPDPMPLRHAARELGVPAGQCVMVGDSQLDIAAARSAGMASCAVGWGLYPADALREAEPSRVVATAEELEHALDELISTAG